MPVAQRPLNGIFDRRGFQYELVNDGAPPIEMDAEFSFRKTKPHGTLE